MTDTWFRRLLLMYPPSFRREFGDQIVELFREVRAGADLSTRMGRLRFRARIVKDFATTATRAWASRIVPRRSTRVSERGSSVTADSAAQNLKYAVRAVVKRPGFATVIVVTLALGLGANTAIFTLVNEILLRPLPIGDPPRVVDIYAVTPGANSFSGFSYPNYLEYRDRNEVLSDVAAFMGTTVRRGLEAGAEPLRAQFSTANYFDVVQVTPIMGRSFVPEDGVRGGGRAVAVVSYDYWQHRAGGDSSLVGSPVRLNGLPFTVIGILPERFEGTFIGFPMDVWLPLATAARVLPNFDLSDRGAPALEFVGRLRPGVSVGQAQAGFDLIAQQLEAEYPVINRGKGAGVSPTTGVDHSMRGAVTGFLGVLMLVTALVLLITCLNVGSLLLARSTSRRKEMAVRLALGASRGRVAGQLLTEVLVLFVLGAVGGAFVADRLTDALLLFVASTPLPLGFDLSIDWRVLAFTALIAFSTAMVAGIFPAREALRQDPIAALRVGGNDDARGASRLRSVFVVIQIAGAFVLLVGAGLFVRSLQVGMKLDPGFDADRVAAAAITLPEPEYDRERGLVFFDALVDRIARLPGVTGASVALRRPIGVAKNPVEIRVPGYDALVESDELLVDLNAVSPEYFATTGIPIVAGRELRGDDGAAGRRVAVINETMASRFWSTEDPVGQSFMWNGDAVQVVGVAADSRYLIQDDAPIAHLYVPLQRSYAPRMNLLVRSTGNPLELGASIQQGIAAMDPDLLAIQLTTLRETIDSSLLPQRVAASVTVGLGAFGLLLASLGIYGILAHAVGRRTREIGIRMALGSRSGGVLRLVVGQGMRLVVIGLLLGTLASLAVTPLMRTFLVGVEPVDAVTIGAVVIVFLVIGALACSLPARRATRVDPTTTLRFE